MGTTNAARSLKAIAGAALAAAAIALCAAMPGQAWADPTEVSDSAGLQDAINSADVVDIRLSGDIDTDVTLVVPAGKTVTLDLNGNTLSGVSADAKASAVIVNNGSLTITDSVGGGKITSSADQPDEDYGTEGFPTYANNTINNYGTLKLESGTVENATEASKGAFYAIDNLNNGSVVVSGGKVVCKNNCAIRQFANGSTSNSVTVNGGEVKGTRAVWMQLPGADASVSPAASLTVNGGKLISTDSTYDLAVYAYSYGNSGANTSISITGGTIDGNVALGDAITKTMKEDAVSVTGGEITGEYGVFSYAEEDEIAAPVISITGGAFATDYSALYAEDDGYVFKANDDGTFEAVDPDELEDDDEGGGDEGGEGEGPGPSIGGDEGDGEDEPSGPADSDGTEESKPVAKDELAQTGDATGIAAAGAGIALVAAGAIALAARRRAA